MVKKSTHPGRQLFDHLSGRLDEHRSREVEEHLSDCADCRSVESLVGVLKNETKVTTEHPSVNELALLFYGKLARELASQTASHVASCHSCADELAEYARAERAASEYNPAQAEAGKIPARAWELILDWEDSSYGQPRAESDVISQEMLLKLSRLLSEREETLRQVEKEIVSRRADEAKRPDLVPVVVVDKEGEFKGVEMFEKVTDQHGASVFKHVDESHRFDEKPLYALLDFGGNAPVIVSDIIRRNTTRLQPVSRSDAELRHADYFIIED